MTSKIERFVGYKSFNIHRFKKSGWSFCVHLSQTFKRIDLHLFVFMVSIGKVPIHQWNTKGGIKKGAVSDSYHQKVVIENKIVLYAEPTCGIVNVG